MIPKRARARWHEMRSTLGKPGRPITSVAASTLFGHADGFLRDLIRNTEPGPSSNGTVQVEDVQRTLVRLLRNLGPRN